MKNTFPSDLDLSIVIPVYNERDNLVPLEEKLEKVPGVAETLDWANALAACIRIIWIQK